MKALLRGVLALAFAILGVAGAALAPNVDAHRTGAPIHPFIYGQFIEHLGRCIYGGIWAEMLEDRKFYFPVTAEYSPYRSLQDTDYPVVGASPWQIVGDAGAVTMVREDAFVGDHSPRVRQGSGVRQRDLGLIAGQAYEGYVWAKPLEGRAEIEVSLAWGPAVTDRISRRLTYSGSRYSKENFRLTVQGGGEKAGVFEIRVLKGELMLGPPSLMPADNLRGLRRDTLALLKQLNGTIYRWPGGNFVSGYDWRDGIGDRDRRPPRKNPAWTGVEHNDFGTDEFIDFCREIGTEPMIAVNTGFGDAYSAAQWVEYCNGSARSVAGGWRAKNASRAPYAVKYWCVGNEMFGPWQLGFMQMQHYTQKHNSVATAMRRVDPGVVLTGVGDLETINRNHDPDQAKSGKGCTQIMLEDCAEHMELISEHFYQGRLPWTQDGQRGLQDHVRLLADAVRRKADGHRKLQAGLSNLKGRVIPIAMDEWNYWHREYVYGELGCQYDLADGLGVAAGLHEFFRQSDLIHMAHYAQTVNVIGAIKTSRTAAQMETTGLVLQMYRAHFGEIPIQLGQEFAPYDVVAALTRDRRTLTFGVVNPTREEVVFQPAFRNVGAVGPGERWWVGGAEPSDHNTPGQPRKVDLRRSPAAPLPDGLRVPPLSCAVFRLPIQ